MNRFCGIVFKYCCRPLTTPMILMSHGTIFMRLQFFYKGEEPQSGYYMATLSTSFGLELVDVDMLPFRQIFVNEVIVYEILFYFDWSLLPWLTSHRWRTPISRIIAPEIPLHDLLGAAFGSSLFFLVRHFVLVNLAINRNILLSILMVLFSIVRIVDDVVWWSYGCCRCRCFVVVDNYVLLFVIVIGLYYFVYWIMISWI